MQEGQEVNRSKAKNGSKSSKGWRPAVPVVPLAIVISGPAGAGKTTLCKSLMALPGEIFSYATTTTTRPPRPAEVDGKDYYFVSTEEFQSSIARGEFCEHATVHGRHLYGLKISELERHFVSGRSVLITMDVHGAMTLKGLSVGDPQHVLHSRVVSIFLMPPRRSELYSRLWRRENIDEDEVASRMFSMETEMQSAGAYDYRIPSTSQKNTVENFMHIYHAEQMRRVRCEFVQQSAEQFPQDAVQDGRIGFPL
ncbi:MAG: guanylate kinase [Puniceicoccales bacterium]|jgi:guanylate kinase|nr:guanylate kinase [Puniceicoccales bacterium]